MLLSVFFLSITRYLTFTLFPELATEKDETSLILERCVSYFFILLSLKVYDTYFLRHLISTHLLLTFREFQDSFARLQRCTFHSCQFFTEIKRKVSLSDTERGVWILLRCVKTQMRIEKKQRNSLHYDNFVSEFFLLVLLVLCKENFTAAF